METTTTSAKAAAQTLFLLNISAVFLVGPNCHILDVIELWSCKGRQNGRYRYHHPPYDNVFTDRERMPRDRDSVFVLLQEEWSKVYQGSLLVGLWHPCDVAMPIESFHEIAMLISLMLPCAVKISRMIWNETFIFSMFEFLVGQRYPSVVAWQWQLRTSPFIRWRRW